MRPVEEILAGLPDRISRLVFAWAERDPASPALTDGDRTLSYAAYAAEVRRLLGWFVEAGVRPGDRVMLVSENGLALPPLVMAASEGDAWAVIVNARLSAREIDQIRDHSGARRVFYCLEGSPDAAAHAERHGAAVHDLDGLGRVAMGPLLDAVPEPVDADAAGQVAALIYTSGTTGNPKGVMLTHRNLLYIAAVSGGLRGLDHQDRVYGVLPISHVFGLASMFLGSTYAGALLRLAPRFDPARVAASLESEGITVLQGVPAMYARLREHLAATGRDRLSTPALRYLSAGGSPLDPALKAAVEALFGIPLHNGYGLTESAPTVSQTRHDAPRADCSSGPLLPGLEAKLVGPEGAAVEAGGVGELWVRGPNVMKGYYKAPDETAAVIDAEGWLNTRDLARFEDDCLWIVGRTRELIIRSGFNVYPPEVEAVLNSHPEVTQSAVVGRKVEGNEEVIAFVQLRPGAAADADALARFAAERLAPYKRPQEILLLEAFPASATGKVLKHRLAALAQQRDPAAG
jgi:acyl-CoA synthetase (AMP-forming)/AMP-acid ligase II